MQDAKWKSWLLEQAATNESMAILDIGCGTGVLEERMTFAGQVVGVDITVEMLRLAQMKEIPSIRGLSLGDGEHLPFRDGSFDVVLSCYVVKYCSPEQLAKEMARVLRTGGTLVLYDFSSPRGPFAPFHAIYLYGALKMFGKVVNLFDPKTAFTYLVLPDVIRSRVWDEQFEEVLRSSGFSSVRSKRLTGGVVTGYRATRE